MAQIKPFKGVLYNKEKIDGEFSDVVAPPYDVISDVQVDQLYSKSSYNVIRLILGKIFQTDNESDNRYSRAKSDLEEWMKKGVLSVDKEDSFYVYLQKYEFKGTIHRRIGFFGLMKIGEPDNDMVVPHEHTLKKPKEDRLNLIKEVKANLSPIFTVFSSNDSALMDLLNKTVETEEPIFNIEKEDGSHGLWRLSDKEGIDLIIEKLKDKKVYIADGHHRYEVSRQYRNYVRETSDSYDGRADYVLMYFSDINEKNEFTVLGTHRVLKKLDGAGDSDIKSKLADYFDFEEYGTMRELEEKLDKSINTLHVFGYYSGGKYLLLKPKDQKALRSLVKADKSDDWKELDVSILHAVILDKILCNGNEEGNITYVKQAGTAEELVKEGSHEAAFILNPTQVDQLKRVADKGDMMPQKSTYFYPKLLSGLVINSLVKRESTVINS